MTFEFGSKGSYRCAVFNISVNNVFINDVLSHLVNALSYVIGSVFIICELIDKTFSHLRYVKIAEVNKHSYDRAEVDVA